jgi:hypothetical protein
MSKVELLDSLAWALLSESAVLGRLANMLVREHNHYSYPTQKTFTEAIRATKPPRGRAGPMLELLEKEFRRQKPIVHKRLMAHAEWDHHLKISALRSFRINAAYASVFKQAVFIGSRSNPLPYSAAWEERKKWDDEETNRPKGDNCLLLILHQGCIVAVLGSTDNNHRPQIRVRQFGTDQTCTTFLRSTVINFGDLLSALGGEAVTGALAHGHRVEINYPDREFLIHREDGSTFTAPWLAVSYTPSEKAWQADDANDIVVTGRDFK